MSSMAELVMKMGLDPIVAPDGRVWEEHGIYYSYENEDTRYEEKVFKNLQETKKYAMKNKGSIFIKNPNGLGYILKQV